MTTRSILGLLYASKVYSDLGVDTQAVFRKHGLSIEHMDENATIDRTRELEIILDLYRLKPDPELGLLIGSNMGLAGYGPLSMLIMTCENAYEDCQMGIKYQELTYLFGTISMELGNQYSSLILTPSALPEEIALFLLYRDLSGTVKFTHDVQQMNGQKMELRSIELCAPKPQNLKLFKDTFNCSIEFEKKQNQIFLTSAMLKAPYHQANKMALNIYREQCDQQLQKARNMPENLAKQLAKYLAMFSYRLPSVVEAAQAFGFSERTFRRQLAAEQSSYQKILDQVRFDKAKNWLTQSQMNIDAISEKLGYQEAAAFNHAFKRWAGCTPSQFRKDHSFKI